MRIQIAFAKDDKDQTLPTSTPQKISKEEVAKIEENYQKLEEIRRRVGAEDKE